MVFVLSLCLPACPSSLPSPAGSKAGSLAFDKVHIKTGWLRWLLAEHQVCSWLALLSACSRPSMIQPSAELLLFAYVTQSPALNTLLVYVILHSWYSPSCSDFRYCLLAYYYRSQSTSFHSATGHEWLASGNSRHGQKEYVACEASQDGLELLKSICLPEANSAGSCG